MRNQTDSAGKRTSLESRIAAYVATAAGLAAASEAKAVIVANNTVQPFGINGSLNIDFNTDGQTDFQIDHDRVVLPGNVNVDFLQLDKTRFNDD